VRRRPVPVDETLDPEAERRAELSVRSLLSPSGTWSPSEIRADPVLLRNDERRRDGVALQDEMLREGHSWAAIRAAVVPIVIPAL
jgi:hypothetical protein